MTKSGHDRPSCVRRRSCFGITNGKDGALPKSDMAMADVIEATNPLSASPRMSQASVDARNNANAFESPSGPPPRQPIGITGDKDDAEGWVIDDVLSAVGPLTVLGLQGTPIPDALAACRIGLFRIEHNPLPVANTQCNRTLAPRHHEAVGLE